MSAKVDNDRKTASRESRLEEARRRYDMQLVVITGNVEGVSKAEIARRLKARFGKGCAQMVWRIEVFLGLLTGRRWKSTGRRTGRLGTRRAIEGVRP